MLTFPSFEHESNWAVWVCTKLGFASMIDGTFGYDRTGATTQKLRNAREAFTEELCRRLEHVVVECEDGVHLIRRYDTPDAFHFVDPPYVGSDCGHYNGTFDEADLMRLLEMLASMRGKFMLTMFPHAGIECRQVAHVAVQIGHAIQPLARRAYIDRDDMLTFCGKPAHQVRSDETGAAEDEGVPGCLTNHSDMPPKADRGARKRGVWADSNRRNIWIIV